MTTVALHAGGGSMVLEPVGNRAPLCLHCDARMEPGDVRRLPLPPLRAECVAIFHIVRADNDVALPLTPFPT